MFRLARKKPPVPPLRRDVQVEDRVLPLAIRENARATRITLRIEPGGRALRLTVPPGLSARDIDSFLSRHQGWLAARLSGLPQDVALGQGSLLPVRGIEHRIELTGRLRGLVTTADGENGPVLLVPGEAGHAGRRLADFLKREARRDLEVLVTGHAAAVGRKVRSIALKDTKSRWGSCSSGGNLSFSWRIAMAPPFIIDYLAAHEVAHLVEMNHGPEFWRLCRHLCPRTETAKAWLKRHGSHLQAIPFHTDR